MFPGKTIRRAVGRRALLLVLSGLLVVIAGCTGSGHKPDATTAAPPSGQSAMPSTPRPESPLALDVGTVVHAMDLAGKVAPLGGCQTPTQPQDMLQSPYPVAAVSCGALAGGGVDLYVFRDRSQRSYAIKNVETGEGHSFHYLVGDDWVAIAKPEMIQAVKTVLGGQSFADPAAALAANPAPADMDALTTCQQFFTAAAMDFVAHKSDAINQLNQILPGALTFFRAELEAEAIKLPSFGSGDPDRAASDLTPLAGQFRVGCRQLQSVQ